MRGGGKTAACCGRLLSKAFRKDKLDCPLWYGVEGTEILSGKPLAPQQDFEVDHIIGLEMVSEAFSDVFKKQSLETCLQVRSCTCNFFLTDFISCRSYVKWAQLYMAKTIFVMFQKI